MPSARLTGATPPRYLSRCGNRWWMRSEPDAAPLRAAGGRAMPTVRPEILAQLPQQRRLLLRPLCGNRSPRQVCGSSRCGASGGTERPQVRGLRRAAQGRALHETVLLDTLPGRRPSCACRGVTAAAFPVARPSACILCGRALPHKPPARRPQHSVVPRAARPLGIHPRRPCRGAALRMSASNDDQVDTIPRHLRSPSTSS